MRLADSVVSDDHVQGTSGAAVTLVQYGDYECPYTRLSRYAVRQLQREYPDTLRFVFRHFPLEQIHPHARAAALAAEASGAQTDFWTMHEYSSSTRTTWRSSTSSNTPPNWGWTLIDLSGTVARLRSRVASTKTLIAVNVVVSRERRRST